MMTTKEQRKIESEALGRYGIEAQTLMLAEEMGELIKACNKLIRHKGKHDLKRFFELTGNLAEEIADVQIMIDQISLCWLGSELPNPNVALIKQAKLERLKMRMEDEGKGETCGSVDCVQNPKIW